MGMNEAGRILEVTRFPDRLLAACHRRGEFAELGEAPGEAPEIERQSWHAGQHGAPWTGRLGGPNRVHDLAETLGGGSIFPPGLAHHSLDHLVRQRPEGEVVVAVGQRTLALLARKVRLPDDEGTEGL